MDPPTEKFPGWSTFLPWHPAYRTPHIRFTLLENTPDRIVINIDFCRNRHTAECKLVIAKGSGTQHLAGGDVEFDFDAHFEDIRLEDYQEKRLSVGSNVGVPGTFPWCPKIKSNDLTDEVFGNRNYWMVFYLEASRDRFSSPSSTRPSRIQQCTKRRWGRP